MTDAESRVIGLAGVPLDMVTMAGAVARVRDAVRLRQRLLVSTPNLNFLIACQRDAVFRQSVIDSDLSLADGMPLVWMSRWLASPLPERVTGSGLFEALRQPVPGVPPVRVYFFGGPPGIAAAAVRQVNAVSGGVHCVGHADPGFGSLDDMSSAGLLADINASGADFLIVALGAAKGQAWIQRNAAALQVPVISHLGAVVNFAAGTVRRAPAWVQRSGLEWLWRIKEEPALWRRYWRDSVALVRLAIMQVLPCGLWLRHQHERAGAVIAWHDEGACGRLVLQGWLPDRLDPGQQAAVRQAMEHEGPLQLDCHSLTGFGPQWAGRLLRLERRLRCHPDRTVQVAGLSPSMQRLWRWNGLTFYLARMV
ncbi:WecB/TagA/CpsF family glycosyltransferase [Laribacter hongkongensis]|uniref:WecB/TagA/CpsF family glycosyltransferase n=1 Tax=Laribacter hongkongensis TaxID=168471 RepID=UPI001EFCFEC1|nr:WecB/TagA/CpsF family glycosyltransferase [Laribacter hongkongensis]MCG9047581.1 WecB/TagA/CpsF family glycosyltransferase [Laribacter hongkongensis]